MILLVKVGKFSPIDGKIRTRYANAYCHSRLFSPAKIVTGIEFASHSCRPEGLFENAVEFVARFTPHRQPVFQNWLFRRHRREDPKQS